MVLPEEKTPKTMAAIMRERLREGDERGKVTLSLSLPLIGHI